MTRFIDIVRSLLPLSQKDKDMIQHLERILAKDNVKQIIELVKQKKVGLMYSNLGLSRRIVSQKSILQLHVIKASKEVNSFVEEANKELENAFKIELYREFSDKAHKIIPEHIAPMIKGYDIVKETAALMLFAKENIHMLLLGDPGTGKTQILHSTTDLAPISSFGLGSGTSSAGLSVTMKGDEVQKGLLPMAHNGICAIDELNLMKKEDMASLYNAMEKGFITYDKGGKHFTFDAKVNVIATANPKKDKFAGFIADTIKKQLPFDAALLSRFHVVFFIKKPDLDEFVEITKSIMKDTKKKLNVPDYRFIKEYVEYTRNLEVEFPEMFEENVVSFIRDIKKNENKYLIEITPRLVNGFKRLAIASARMRLSNSVELDDIMKVKNIISTSLNLKNTLK